jgi:hypothetical protein
MAPPLGAAMRLHRKQFIISSCEHIWSSNWRSIKLADDCWLSYDRDLCIEQDKDTGALLLGLAIPLPDPRGKGDLKASYTGRYVSIDWPYLYTDAAALLAVFWGRVEETLVVTSSTAFAGDVFGYDQEKIVELVWNGMNWVPPPGSTIGTLAKLFCDQRINLVTGEVEKTDWILQPHPSIDEAALALSNRLIAAMRAFADRFDTLYLGLTAGLDSRTFLAALLASGVSFKTITHSFPGMDPVDLATARELSARFGFEHQAITARPHDAARLAKWRAHTGGAVADADAFHFIPGDHYRFLQPNDLMIRGNCVEICRRWYDFKLRKSRDELNGDNLWRAFDKREPSARYVAYFDRWLEWRRANDIGLDLVECFYLDQRVGGWAAAGELGYDILDGHSIQAINSLSYFSDLISGSNHQLRTGEIQLRAIRLMFPQLLEVELNRIGLLDWHKRGKYALKKIFRGKTMLSEYFWPPEPRQFEI